MVTREQLLNALPPYRDEWELIHPDQKVDDIIAEVLEAHDEFAPYYDKLALFFEGSDPAEIAENLFQFLQSNISYVEETEDDQTTALPAGILTRGHGDCKHYSGFSGGILDALNRRGRRIRWAYRFASYDPTDATPHHVFIIVYDKQGREIWVDPTPGSEFKIPVYYSDKKISAPMSLRRNIAGMADGAAIGLTSINVTPVTNASLQFQFSPADTALTQGIFPHYLGLSDYRDMSGDRSINEWGVADTLNNLIRASGATHQVTGDFVKWVYDNSLRSWNFFYPGGVEPGFNGAEWLPASWPRWVITPDGRLTLDRDVQVDDYRNAPIHILTAWAQALINQYDPTAYPLRPVAVKEFSQRYTGNPGNPEANLFTEARGSSVFADIGQALEDTVNFVKEGVLKVFGSIPRNAFLVLVRINAFHMASDLQEHIAAGDWDHIADKWRSLGGNPDNLRNTIDDGAARVAVEDPGTSVDATLGAVQLAAIIAAAGPIIVAMLQFLNKDGKLNGAITATEGFLKQKFPGSDWSFLNGALTQNGQPVQWTVDPTDDENSPYYQPTPRGIALSDILVGAAAAVAAWFLINKPGRQKNYVVPIGAGVLGYWLNSRYHFLKGFSAPSGYTAGGYAPMPTAPVYSPPLLAESSDLFTGGGGEEIPSSYDSPTFYTTDNLSTV